MAKYQIEMLNVGNGDCLLIQYFHNRDDYSLIMIDAGPSGKGESILKHLNQYYPDHAIDYAIVTHPDEDHYGGYIDLLNKQLEQPENVKSNNDSETKPVPIKKFIINGLDLFHEDYKDLKKAIKKIGIPTEEKFDGDLLAECPIKFLSPSRGRFKSMEYLKEELDSIHFSIDKILESKSYNSIDDYDDDTSSSNASSIVFLFQPNGKKYLFTGDATRKTLNEVLTNHSDDVTNCYWLKVPHHGSIGNLTVHLIDAINPKISYISAVGDGLHPSDGIVKLLEKKGEVYITNNKHNFSHPFLTYVRPNWGPTYSSKFIE